MTFAPSFHVLAKPTGRICNLGCEYRGRRAEAYQDDQLLARVQDLNR